MLVVLASFSQQVTTACEPSLERCSHLSQPKDFYDASVATEIFYTGLLMLSRYKTKRVECQCSLIYQHYPGTRLKIHKTFWQRKRFCSNHCRKPLNKFGSVFGHRISLCIKTSVQLLYSTGNPFLRNRAYFVKKKTSDLCGKPSQTSKKESFLILTTRLCLQVTGSFRRWQWIMVLYLFECGERGLWGRELRWQDHVKHLKTTLQENFKNFFPAQCGGWGICSRGVRPTRSVLNQASTSWIHHNHNYPQPWDSPLWITDSGMKVLFITLHHLSYFLDPMKNSLYYSKD